MHKATKPQFLTASIKCLLAESLFLMLTSTRSIGLVAEKILSGGCVLQSPSPIATPAQPRSSCRAVLVLRHLPGTGAL